MSQNKNNRFLPLWLALCVVIGVIIGTFYANHFSGNRLNIINSGSCLLYTSDAADDSTEV